MGYFSHVLKVESFFGGFPLVVTPRTELLINPSELIQMERYFIVFIREIPKAHVLELIPLSPWRKHGDRLGPLIYTHTEHLSPRPVGLSVPFLGFAFKSVLGFPPKVFSVVSGRLYVETLSGNITFGVGRVRPGIVLENRLPIFLPRDSHLYFLRPPTPMEFRINNGNTQICKPYV